jgi:hypothetical protein
MSMTTEHSKTSNPSEGDKGSKRAYIKPAFRHEKVFEVMALACGKVSGNQAGCKNNRKTS